MSYVAELIEKCPSDKVILSDDQLPVCYGLVEVQESVLM